ncbi:hypothetical protein [Fluviicola sp.]|uniref:hypothetical protein n=1 Tax=Fluviicola sp. TaxID=1917219 RepID=UPI0031D5FC85
MKKITLHIESDDLEQLAAVGIAYFNSFNNKYIKQTKDMVLAASEVYKMRNGSTQMNMLVLYRENGITIDIMGAAGGTGVFNWSWGSEAGFTREMAIRYKNYCEKHGLKFVGIE